MSTVHLLADRTVDVVFPMDAQTLLRDHAQALQLALCEQWPWLVSEPLAGIHPIKVVHGLGESALLSRRVRLMLRLGASRATELLSFQGAVLTVAGETMRLGVPHLRELQPHATLYAYRVAADNGDELSFMANVDRELGELGIGGVPVCGLRHRMQVSGQPVDTFSLMLHQLAPQQSLQLQRCGVGSRRLLGCGLFVPHKSAAAV